MTLLANGAGLKLCARAIFPAIFPQPFHKTQSLRMPFG